MDSGLSAEETNIYRERQYVTVIRNINIGVVKLSWFKPLFHL